jgi:hypothetical protein
MIPPMKKSPTRIFLVWLAVAAAACRRHQCRRLGLEPPAQRDRKIRMDFTVTKAAFVRFPGRRGRARLPGQDVAPRQLEPRDPSISPSKVTPIAKSGPRPAEPSETRQSGRTWEGRHSRLRRVTSRPDVDLGGKPTQGHTRTTSGRAPTKVRWDKVLAACRSRPRALIMVTFKEQDPRVMGGRRSAVRARAGGRL